MYMQVKWTFVSEEYHTPSMMLAPVVSSFVNISFFFKFALNIILLPVTLEQLFKLLANSISVVVSISNFMLKTSD